VVGIIFAFGAIGEAKRPHTSGAKRPCRRFAPHVWDFLAFTDNQFKNYVIAYS